MSQVAFALRDNIDEDTFEGSVNVPGHDFSDVGAQLREGKGVIVTDDTRVIEALDTYPPLKRTTVPDAAKQGYVPPPRVDPKLAGLSGEHNEGVQAKASTPAPPAVTGSQSASFQPQSTSGATQSAPATDASKGGEKS